MIVDSFYNNIIEYEINEVGYVIFTNSILETIEFKKNSNMDFILYHGEAANKIHTESINHYGAGKKEKVFGKNYIAWQTEEYK